MKTARLKALIWLLGGIWVIGATGCGHYPSHLTSRLDIERTSRSETHVTVSGLSTEDFAALSKFQNLYEIDLEGGGTDSQLEALARNGFSNLTEVVLTECPQVTDRGISALLRVSTLKGLGLRGTSVSDGGCRIIASQMKLSDVNLPNCPQVTAKGLLALAQSETIEVLGFSLDHLTQADLIQIINAARRVDQIEIDIVGDADKSLDLPELRNAAHNKGISLLGVRNHVALSL
jgi:hypothetical protein